MARKITLAILQSALTDDAATNIERVSKLVRQAAAKGADVILPSELFEGHYFCTSQEEENFARAHPWRESPAVKAMAKLAAELNVVIPVSIFEKAGPAYFNTVVMIDADGSLMGIYRKSHIPDGPGYQEKYYFRPGDTGFRVWDTKKGRIGTGMYPVVLAAVPSVTEISRAAFFASTWKFSYYAPNTLRVLASVFSMGVPVKPMKDALGKASRRCWA